MGGGASAFGVVRLVVPCAAAGGRSLLARVHAALTPISSRPGVGRRWSSAPATVLVGTGRATADAWRTKLQPIKPSAWPRRRYVRRRRRSTRPRPRSVRLWRRQDWRWWPSTRPAWLTSARTRPGSDLVSRPALGDLVKPIASPRRASSLLDPVERGLLPVRLQLRCLAVARLPCASYSGWRSFGRLTLVRPVVPPHGTLATVRCPSVTLAGGTVRSTAPHSSPKRDLRGAPRLADGPRRNLTSAACRLTSSKGRPHWTVTSDMAKARLDRPPYPRTCATSPHGVADIP
jgi:hypothetical protein